MSILPCPSNRLQYNVIAAFCGAQRRAGFRYLKQSRRNLDCLNNILIPHIDNIHNSEQNIRLIEKLTRISRDVHPDINKNIVLKTIGRDAEFAEEFIRKNQLTDNAFIGLHVSSSRAKHMERKCWPKESFLEFIQKLQDQKPEMNFVIFSGTEDLENSEWLINKAGSKRLHLAKDIPIRPIAEILKKSRLLLTNDSGIMHVGIAAKVPTVALFGPTNPRRSGPWQSASSQVIRSDLPCSPCFYHTSHELTCPAGLNFECIRKLPVDKVLQTVLTILDH